MGLATLLGAVTGGFGASGATLVSSSSRILGGFANSQLVTGIGGTIAPVGSNSQVIVNSSGAAGGGAQSGWMKTMTEITGILFIITCIITFFVNAYEIYKLLKQPGADQVLIDSKGFDTETGIVEGYIQSHNFVAMIGRYFAGKAREKAIITKIQTRIERVFSSASVKAGEGGFTKASVKISFETLAKQIAPKTGGLFGYFEKDTEVAILGQAADIVTVNAWVAMLTNLENDMGLSDDLFKKSAQRQFAKYFAIKIANVNKKKKEQCGQCPEVILKIEPGKFVCTDESYSVKIQSAAKSWLDANGKAGTEGYGDYSDKLFELGYFPSWLGKKDANDSEQLDDKKVREALTKVATIDFTWVDNKEYKYSEAVNIALNPDGSVETIEKSQFNDSRGEPFELEGVKDEIISFTHGADDPNPEGTWNHAYVLSGEDRAYTVVTSAETDDDGNVISPVQYSAVTPLVNDCSDPYYWISEPATGGLVGLPQGGYGVDDIRHGKSKDDFKSWSNLTHNNYMGEIEKKILGESPYENEFGIRMRDMEAFVRPGFIGHSDMHWTKGGTVTTEDKPIKPFTFKAVNFICIPYGRKDGKGRLMTEHKSFKGKWGWIPQSDHSAVNDALKKGGSSIEKLTGRMKNSLDRRRAKGKFDAYLEAAKKNNTDIYFSGGGKTNTSGYGAFYAVVREPVTNCDKCTNDTGENCITIKDVSSTTDFIIGIPYVIKVKKKLRSQVTGTGWNELIIPGEQKCGEAIHEKANSPWKVSDGVITPPCRSVDDAGGGLSVTVQSNYSY
jgi:hypothetical protein